MGSGIADKRIDAVAAAIASTPRRHILELVAAGPQTMTELAHRLAMSVPLTHKHVSALVGAELVQRTKTGRVVTISLVPGSLQPLADWATQTRLLWAGQLDRLAGHLAAARRSTTHQPAPSADIEGAS